jgi:hypothetical protein
MSGGWIASEIRSELESPINEFRYVPRSRRGDLMKSSTRHGENPTEQTEQRLRIGVATEVFVECVTQFWQACLV